MMSDEENRRAIEAMVAFESSLADIVLEAFARGARIEGDWTIEPDVSDAPAWVVTVSKVESEAGAGYDCSFIDERPPNPELVRSRDEPPSKGGSDGTQN